jgi:hypothetical protein
MSNDLSKLTRKERRSALIGMVLGDASLYRQSGLHGSDATVLKITHSIKQSAYLEWKRDIIQPMFDYPLTITETYNRANNGKSYPVVKILTKSNPQLKRLRKIMYNAEGTKRVTPQILNALDDRGVAIWYCDDWCLSKTVGRGATVIAATNCFTHEEHLLMREWFADVYGVCFNIYQHKSGTYHLRRGISDAYKLLDRIAPYIVPSLSYKVEYPQPKRGRWYSLPSTVPGSDRFAIG